jgi:peroxiredoxin
MDICKWAQRGITYGVVYIPTTYIIDQQGRVVYKNVGVTPYSALSIEIDKLL